MSKHFFHALAHQILIVFLIASGSLSANCAQQPAHFSGRSVQSNSDDSIINLVREAALPLRGNEQDYDRLIELIGDARFVMLGEATHGTHEFYRERARITRRLIEEKGFNAVVIEGDWTDVGRVNRYIKGESKDANARKALSDFTRFPQWMWRNTDFHDFVNVLRAHNESRSGSGNRVGLYGMDLYSLSGSASAVINYLKTANHEAAMRARKRYSCFARYRDEPQRYGLEVSNKTARSCEKETRQQFEELRQMLANHKRSDTNRQTGENLFNAYQNAQVVKNAEEYYRTIYREDISSWNVRDRHMAETLNDLINYLDSYGGDKSKVVVWAHNTHQGDAQATYMAEQGEWNVGQLIRQQHGENAVLVGFTTYTGYVRAASEWGGFDERKRVRPAIEGSYSDLFHKTGIPNFLLILQDGGGQLTEDLRKPRLQRAIGVIYLPATERRSHYFNAQIADQFDAVIHFDVTTAVKRVY